MSIQSFGLLRRRVYKDVSFIVREMPAFPGVSQASFYMIFPKPWDNVLFLLNGKNSDFFQ